MTFPFKTVPMPHQIDGVSFLTTRIDPVVGRVIPGCMLLGDPMRLGKTKQVIDAAHVLHARGEIDRVLVITTNAGKSVWWDPEFGEIRKHTWDDVGVEATLVHQRDRTWTAGPPAPLPLQWYVTNYEYTRTRERGAQLPTRLEFTMIAGPRTVLVLDESSAVAGHKSQQTQACRHLRWLCPWVWLLNGTPISDSPEDAFSQCLIMHPAILGVQYITHFRARYGVLEQHTTKNKRRYFTVLHWKNLDDLQKRIAPYVLRRPESVAGLPPVLPPITLTTQLEPTTWAAYKELRDEFVLWADAQTTLTAAQAGVRLIRLAQMTSGFLGGLMKMALCAFCEGEECTRCGGSGVIEIEQPPRELGREKTDLVLDWLADQVREEPDLKVVVWCRFRAELERLYTALRGDTRFIHFQVAQICGGQNREERREALRLLHPETAPTGPAAMVGTTSTGAMALNLSAASLAVYISNDAYLRNRMQSEARIRMGGQTRPVQHVDVVAEGPSGQKTVDHLVVGQLHDKRELVDSIVSQWVQELRDA